MAPPTAAASTSPWGKWGATAAYAVGGALVAGATAGAAYQKREDLGLGYAWATDHMKYVRNLWNVEALNKRVDSLLDLEAEVGVVFRTCVLPFLPFRTSKTKLVIISASTRSFPQRHFSTIPLEPSLFSQSLSLAMRRTFGKRKMGWRPMSCKRTQECSAGKRTMDTMS